MYFSIHGRLARTPYFIRSLQLSILFTILFVASIPLFTSGSDQLWWLGLAVVTIAAVVLVDGAVCLVVRRLHDLGLSGYHSIWTTPLLAAPASGRDFYLAIPMICVSLWLTFWPGQKAPNRFDA